MVASAGHRGTTGVHEAVGPRQPAHRWRFGRRCAGAVPEPRAAVGEGRNALGRRATDAGARPGVEPQPVDPARRRAVPRTRRRSSTGCSARSGGGGRTRYGGADRRAARPQGVAVRRPDVPDGARQILLGLRRRGAPTPRRDRGRVPARHLGDRGGPHRAAAPEEQAEAVEAPACSGARTGTSHGKIVSTRKAEDDDYYFEVERRCVPGRSA